MERPGQDSEAASSDDRRGCLASRGGGIRTRFRNMRPAGAAESTTPGPSATDAGPSGAVRPRAPHELLPPRLEILQSAGIAMPRAQVHPERRIVAFGTLELVTGLLAWRRTGARFGTTKIFTKIFTKGMWKYSAVAPPFSSMCTASRRPCALGIRATSRQSVGEFPPVMSRQPARNRTSTATDAWTSNSPTPPLHTFCAANALGRRRPLDV